MSRVLISALVAGVADVIQEETYQRLLTISRAAAATTGAAGSNQQKIGDQYKRGTKIGGLTPAQRSFIGWSLGWMNQIRPENLAVRVKTDVHATSPLRVIGPASNMVPFHEAYGVKPGDRMYRANSVRVQIW